MCSTFLSHIVYFRQAKLTILAFLMIPASASSLLRTLGLRRPTVSSIVGVFLILAFTSHVSYLTFVSFDYGYNMAANATIGEAHIGSSVWLCCL